MTPAKAGIAVIGLLILLLLLPSLLGLRFVDAGEVGVVTRFGRVTGRNLDPGAHFVMPFVDRVLTYDTKLVVYETRKEIDGKLAYDKVYDEEASVYLDYPVDTNTLDGQRVNIYYTVRFSVDPTRAGEIAQEVGSEDALVGKIVKTESRIWARNIPREYDAASLYSGNVVDVQNKIADRLRPVFEENGIFLDEVGIREIEFTEEYVRAIEQKQIEAVKVETEQNIAEQAKFQKEARITQAQAQAEEQRLQRETLDGQVLEKIKLDVQREQINKWNGAYPQYLFLGTEGQDFLLGLPEAKPQ